jgi:tetratricopeptide (TPR) repeat protein
VPDDLSALHFSADLSQSTGDFAGVRKLLRSIIDKNRADLDDYNGYTWNALFTGEVTDDDISMLQRAIAADNGSGYNEIHTLACLYAEMGKTKEAREMLLRAMKAEALDEPDSPIWYGFGRIAEDYGLLDAARAFYNRVAKSTEENSNLITEPSDSTYNLAQRRLKLVAAQTAKATIAHK